MDRRRRAVLGMPVDAVDMAGAVAAIDEELQGGGRRRTVLAMNPEKVFALENNPDLQEVFEGAFLVVPDGIGIVLALRVLHSVSVGRVPGADLMQELCNLAARRGYRVFLYGATEEVNAESAHRLAEQYPGLDVVGRQNGFLPDERMGELIDRLNVLRPDILFVALGSPRQERWMQQHLSELDVGICQGIGGTLDTIVGTVKRAPEVFQKAGLEWFYRLVKQPSRILRQRLLPVFAARVLKEKVQRGA